jgi:hypothetical protein
MTEKKQRDNEFLSDPRFLQLTSVIHAKVAEEPSTVNARGVASILHCT